MGREITMKVMTRRELGAEAKLEVGAEESLLLVGAPSELPIAACLQDL